MHSSPVCRQVYDPHKTSPPKTAPWQWVRLLLPIHPPSNPGYRKWDCATTIFQDRMSTVTWPQNLTLIPLCSHHPCPFHPELKYAHSLEGKSRNDCCPIIPTHPHTCTYPTCELKRTNTQTVIASTTMLLCTYPSLVFACACIYVNVCVSSQFIVR